MAAESPYRVLIFEDQAVIRKALWEIFDRLGYEVFTFPNPGTCPLYRVKKCLCNLSESCSDIILSDLNMPVQSGLDFIEEQLHKGCRCRNIGLMSGDFEPRDVARANSLGLRLFNKPFRIEDVMGWIKEVENRIPPDRKLAAWFLNQSIGSAKT